MAFHVSGGIEAEEERNQKIERAILAALMHVKPDYRSPSRLDDCARTIAQFVIAELDQR